MPSVCFTDGIFLFIIKFAFFKIFRKMEIGFFAQYRRVTCIMFDLRVLADLVEVQVDHTRVDELDILINIVEKGKRDRHLYTPAVFLYTGGASAGLNLFFREEGSS